MLADALGKPLTIWYKCTIDLWFCLFSTRWIRTNGILYKPDCVVIIGIEDSYPVFAMVKSLLVVDSNSIYLDCSKLNTVNFFSHRHLYIVEHSSYSVCKHLSELYNPFPLHCRKVNLDQFRHCTKISYCWYSSMLSFVTTLITHCTAKFVTMNLILNLCLQFLKMYSHTCGSCNLSGLVKAQQYLRPTLTA